MSQLNTANTSNPDFYNLGRGRLYFATLSSGLPTYWQDLGNCPNLTLNSEEETIEHKSSRSGLATVDKKLTLSRETSINFDLDEISFDNLARWFSGDATASAETSTATYTDEAIFGTGSRLVNYELERWYDIRDAANARIYYLNLFDSYTITQSPSNDLVKGQDYEIEEEAGMLKFLAGGDVSAGTTAIELTSTGTDVNIDKVEAFTQGSVTGALKFVAVNPANSDDVREFLFHQVTLASDGDLGLISDEFGTMSFAGTVERNEIADSDSPFCTVRGVGAA